MSDNQKPLLAASAAAHSLSRVVRSLSGRPPVDTTRSPTILLPSRKRSMADGAAPADDDPVTQGDSSSPQARPVDACDAPVSLPGAVAKAAAEASGDALPPPLSVVEAQRRLVDSQMRCARATEAQGMCTGQGGPCIGRVPARGHGRANTSPI